MGGRATERRRAEGETKPRKGWKGGKGDRRWEARTSPRATSTAWRWLVSALVLKFHLQAHGSHWRTANKRVTFGPSWPIVHGPEIQRDYRVVSEIWWSRSHLYSILTNHGKLWSKKKNDIRWLIFFFLLWFTSSSQLISGKKLLSACSFQLPLLFVLKRL